MENRIKVQAKAMTPAKHLMETISRYEMEKDEIDDLITTAMGFNPRVIVYPWEDIIYDPYDTSFELIEAANDYRVSGAACMEIKDRVGFRHFWVNHCDGSETYYCMPGCLDGKFMETRKDSSGKQIGELKAL